MDVHALEREHERDLASFDAAVSRLERNITGVDPDLMPEIRSQRIAELRSKAQEELKDARIALLNRARQAEALSDDYTPEAFRRRARFNSDDMTNSWMSIAASTRLGKTPTGELVAHLRDAVASGNLAMVESIRMEFSSRSDRDREKQASFAETMDRLRLPQAEEGSQAIGRIVGKAALADERFRFVLTGRLDPIAKMNAARQMPATGRSDTDDNIADHASSLLSEKRQAA